VILLLSLFPPSPDAFLFFLYSFFSRDGSHMAEAEEIEIERELVRHGESLFFAFLSLPLSSVNDSFPFRWQRSTAAASEATDNNLLRFSLPSFLFLFFLFSSHTTGCWGGHRTRATLAALRPLFPLLPPLWWPYPFSLESR